MRRRILLAPAFALCLWTLPASAQVDAQIAELNSEALEAYQNLDIENAMAKLQQAISLAEQNGYVGPELAVTYLNLGVVYTSGQNDRDQGLAAFVSAICTQPGIELDPLLSAPEAQEVFAQAQQQAASGACPPPPAGAAPPVYAQPFMPTQAPPSGPGGDDHECPPGMKCDEPGDEDDAGDGDEKPFARWFVQLGFTLGFALVQSGMEADSEPPLDDVIDLESVDLNGDGVVNEMDLVGGIDFDGDGNVDANRYYFDDRSAWVPDADSFDDYEEPEFDIPRGITPVSTQCSADGTRTGPGSPVIDQETGMPFETFLPSKYCVRVEQAGIVMNPALRLAPGYFITDNIALSLPLRFQFDAGEGSLSHMLIGVRGELLFSRMEQATGFPVSWFLGLSYGQIQAKPPPKDPSRPAPYVISGPVAANTGVNVRFRLHRNFGLILAPEIDVMLPDFLLNIDLMAGVEAAF